MVFTAFLPFGELTLQQIKDPAAVAESLSYRDADGVKYASQDFEATLREAFKSKDNKYTVFDVAFMDFVCRAWLLGWDLGTIRAAKLNEEHGKCVSEAVSLAETDVEIDGAVLFRIIAADADTDETDAASAGASSTSSRFDCLILCTRD